MGRTRATTVMTMTLVMAIASMTAMMVTGIATPDSSRWTSPTLLSTLLHWTFKHRTAEHKISKLDYRTRTDTTTAPQLAVHTVFDAHRTEPQGIRMSGRLVDSWQAGERGERFDPVINRRDNSMSPITRASNKENRRKRSE
ncbi:hypothetical protein B0T09DRAFT_390386 [Sordaria sp. MPI-SDFR-AT-0083]|nr:hypothetical protein B0T09DRAFT_390386 [Sordaria sp. MPI-SDFR-AT-0083]